MMFIAKLEAFFKELMGRCYDLEVWGIRGFIINLEKGDDINGINSHCAVESAL